jgi:cytochrome c peroxidase
LCLKLRAEGVLVPRTPVFLPARLPGARPALSSAQAGPRALSSRAMRSVLLLAALGSAPLLLQQAVPPVPPRQQPLGLDEPPPENENRPELVAELGARLFFSKELSRDRSVACASCHRPELGFADDKPRSLGVDGRETERNSPSLLNRAFGAHFMWDGRAASLEEQVLLPIENPLEMDLALDEALARLARDTDFARAFQAAFDAGPSRATLARALAAYVRRLVLGDSPVDRFRAGEIEALNDAERAGLWFYESRGGCWRCHSGANFSDEEFHATGVGSVDGVPEPGRAAVSGEPADRGRWKTPSLRGLSATAPYMHDGSLRTLEEVIEFYRQGGRASANLDPALARIEMSPQDVANLAAFLRALSRRTR